MDTGYPSEERKIGIGTELTVTTERTYTDSHTVTALDVFLVEAAMLEGKYRA